MNKVKTSNKKGKVIIISGPSGSGKTTLYKKILKSRKDIIKSISLTTRKPRPGEKHGRDYFFISKKMFEYKIRAGHLFEHEQFFDNYYGTPRKKVEDLLHKGFNVLLCIDVKGAKRVARFFPKSIRIFIKTKTISELKERLMTRASEGETVIEQRLARAKDELEKAKDYDYVVINDEVEHAFAKLNRIIDKVL